MGRDRREGIPVSRGALGVFLVLPSKEITRRKHPGPCLAHLECSDFLFIMYLFYFARGKGRRQILQLPTRRERAGSLEA